MFSDFSDDPTDYHAAFTAMVGPPSAGARAFLKADWIKTPIGMMLAVADPMQLHLLEFFERKALPAELKRLQKLARSGIAIGRLPPIDAIESELRAYFAGRSATFRTPMAQPGSPFQQAVWQTLRSIPLGQTRTYTALAHETGRPDALRAVARANGANQLAILVPCHRVLGADGSLTGYGGGLWRKQWLIDHERTMASQDARNEGEFA